MNFCFIFLLLLALNGCCSKSWWSRAFAQKLKSGRFNHAGFVTFIATNSSISNGNLSSEKPETSTSNVIRPSSPSAPDTILHLNVNLENLTRFGEEFSVENSTNFKDLLAEIFGFQRNLRTPNLLTSLLQIIPQATLLADDVNEPLDENLTMIKPRDVGNVFTNIKDAVVETTITVVNATEDAAKTVEDKAKKIVVRSASFPNSTDDQNNSMISTVSSISDFSVTVQKEKVKEDLAEKMKLLILEQLHGNSTVISELIKQQLKSVLENLAYELTGTSSEATVLDDNINEYSENIQGNSKRRRNIRDVKDAVKAAIKITKDDIKAMTNKVKKSVPSVSSTSESETQNSSSETVNEKSTKKGILSEEINSIDKNTKYFLEDTSTDVSQRTQPTEERILEDLKSSLPPIDKNTKYFLGETSTDIKDATGTAQVEVNNNLSTAQTIGNQKKIIKRDLIIKKCKLKGDCQDENHEKSDLSVNVVDQTNPTEKTTKFSEIEERQESTTDEREDFFKYKDWLWEHLEAFKRGSLKSNNSTDEFMKAQHFLLNSGGTDKRATDASEPKIESRIEFDLYKSRNSCHTLHSQSDDPSNVPKRDKRHPNRPFSIVSTTDAEEERNVLNGTGVNSVNKETNKQRANMDLLIKSKPKQKALNYKMSTEKVDTAVDEIDPLIKRTVGSSSSAKPEHFSGAARGRRHYDTIEKEYNDGGGIPTRPLFLIVTIPSFVGMAAVILALCYVTRDRGWCCTLFNASRRSVIIKTPPQPTSAQPRTIVYSN